MLKNRVNTVSRNRLAPVGAKPLPEAMMTYSQFDL